jgi:hypothetical protein
VTEVQAAQAIHALNEIVTALCFIGAVQFVRFLYTLLSNTLR